MKTCRGEDSSLEEDCLVFQCDGTEFKQYQVLEIRSGVTMVNFVNVWTCSVGVLRNWSASSDSKQVWLKFVMD